MLTPKHLHEVPGDWPESLVPEHVPQEDQLMSRPGRTKVTYTSLGLQTKLAQRQQGTCNKGTK